VTVESNTLSVYRGSRRGSGCLSFCDSKFRFAVALFEIICHLHHPQVANRSSSFFFLFLFLLAEIIIRTELKWAIMIGACGGQSYELKRAEDILFFT